jgi:hypothetical protein
MARWPIVRRLPGAGLQSKVAGHGSRILESEVWQMALGERAAFEGLVSDLSPRLAVEIGIGQGGTLERLAAHSDEVHAFDLDTSGVEAPGNATLHEGPSQDLLGPVLAGFEAQGRSVDFVLIDGDHGADGVRADVETVLGSAAVGHAVVLIHDTMNEHVRAGIEAARPEAYPKVTYFDMDFVPGRMIRTDDWRNELWGGFGLALVNAAALRYMNGDVRETDYEEPHSALREWRDRIVERERASSESIRGTPLGRLARPQLEAECVRLRDELRELHERLARADRELAVFGASRSWRITRPLRTTASRVRRSMS